MTLARNPLRTLPMFFAILAASFGIATIVLFAHSVVRTGVAPNDFLRGTLVVRTNGATPAAIVEYARTRPETAGVYRTQLQYVRGRVFDMPVWFPVQLTATPDVGAIATAYGDTLVQGRLPQRGLEVVVPTAFARNRGVGIGDELGGPTDLTPLSLRIVGLLDGPRWVILGSNEGLPAQIAPESVLLFATDDASHDTLETAVAEHFGATAKVRHWSLGSIDAPVADGSDAMSYQGDLELILWFIVLVNASVLAGIGALLSLIYFRQRRPEFVLLSVLGRSRGELFRRVVAELVIVAGAAWAVGLAASYAFTGWLGDTVLRTRGITVDLKDVDPALYTVPLVALIVAVSAFITLLGFLRFDPISEMEMRA